MIKPRRNKARGKHEKSLAPHIVLAVILGLSVVGALGTGVAVAFNAFREIWREQCRVTDRELDVVISPCNMKMVHPDVITLQFGLTNGANLATIPFAELRENLLRKSPNIRDIRIERRLPNRVTVEVVEREPIVRVVADRTRNETGRVADAEGVVFRFSNNTSLLPLVRESATQPTAPGKKLSGNVAAALRLVEEAQHVGDIRILEVDTSHPDYLLATLGNYDRAKIAWDHMQDDTRTARESLARQLKHLSRTIAMGLTPSTTLWIATDWGPGGRIYASAPSRNGVQYQ